MGKRAWSINIGTELHIVLAGRIAVCICIYTYVHIHTHKYYKNSASTTAVTTTTTDERSGSERGNMLRSEHVRDIDHHVQNSSGTDIPLYPPTADTQGRTARDTGRQKKGLISGIVALSHKVCSLRPHRSCTERGTVCQGGPWRVGYPTQFAVASLQTGLFLKKVRRLT